MQQDKSKLAQRADELLADIRELEEELDRESSQMLYYRNSQEIAAKRTELNQIRVIMMNEIRP